MELEDKIRCNELLKEKHSNWLGLSNQKAIRSMLEELDRLQEENEELIKETRKKRIIAPGRRGLTKTYEYGLVVGTKREREYWKNKIREKIEELEKTGCTSYDASTADAYQSQDIGAWKVLIDLLKEE